MNIKELGLASIISTLLGLLNFMLTKNVYIGMLSSATALPLLIVTFRKGRALTITEGEQIAELKDLEELLISLANLMRLGNPPERALIDLINELPHNRLVKELEPTAPLVLCGLPAEKALGLLLVKIKHKPVKELLKAVISALSSRSSFTHESLLLISKVAKSHRELLEEFSTKLKAQRLKARLLIIVNSASLSILSLMLKKLGVILSLPLIGASFLKDVKLPMIKPIDPKASVTITIVYFLLALITSYYISCAVRDPAIHKAIIISLISFCMTNIVVSVLLP